MRSMVEGAVGIRNRCLRGRPPPPAFGWSPSPQSGEELLDREAAALEQCGHIRVAAAEGAIGIFPIGFVAGR